MNEKLKKRLLALMWDELRDWSVARSVERGRGYLSCVEPPVLSPDGGLVAEVHGTDDYYAKLRVDASGRLEGVCTSPVGVRCKHCVALALTAAKRLKAGDDWKTRVADLRTEYKRRPKFVAMLDALTSGRGASSRIADW